MKLSTVIRHFKILDNTIKELRKSMVHLSSNSVNEIRRYVSELENIRDQLLESPISINNDLESFVSHRYMCLQDCLGSTPKLGEPNPLPDPEPSPVTAKEVHIMFFIDGSVSMAAPMDQLSNELLYIANLVSIQCKNHTVPFYTTLVWFGDATEQGRYNYSLVPVKHGSLLDLASKIYAIPKYKTGDIPNTGLLAIYDHIGNIYKSGATNTVIYITNAPPKVAYGASATAVKNKLSSLGIQNVYGIFPLKDKNSYGSLFKDTREINLSYHNLTPWISSMVK